MGYYTVDLYDKTDNSELLAEYLLHKQSVELEKSFENAEDINGGFVEQSGVKNKKCTCIKEKKETLKLHLSDTAKQFTVILKAVLSKYDDVQPEKISADNLEKELITEIIDEVIECAKPEIKELEEIIKEKSHYPFGRYYLLRQIIEVLLLNELL